jgi:hypothetical protein
VHAMQLQDVPFSVIEACPKSAAPATPRVLVGAPDAEGRQSVASPRHGG